MSMEINSAMTARLGGIRSGVESLRQAADRLAAAVSSTGEHNGHGFAAQMGEALRSVNEQDRMASEKMAEVDSGRSGDLVGAMLASQEASLSFSMLLQVRNKVMGAVDELIKLPL